MVCCIQSRFRTQKAADRSDGEQSTDERRTCNIGFGSFWQCDPEYNEPSAAQTRADVAGSGLN